MQMNKLGSQTIERIVILRALQLGDLMCSVPAFRALRMAFPEAEISLVGLPWSVSFVNRFHDYIDSLIEFPGFPGFPEQEPDIQRLPEFLKTVQDCQFDLALQMQGSGGISNPLVMLFGAKITAGFYLPGQYFPENHPYLVYPIHEPEVRRHLSLVDFLGIPKQGEELEFPLYQEDWDEIIPIQVVHRLQAGGYAVIHPGARSATRRWPAEWFALVGDGLAAHGLQIVLTGTEEEALLAKTVQASMKSPTINLAGQTSLGGLGALLSGARLLVCNDTGVSHLAAALNLPSVVLFTASDPDRWAPRDRDLHRVVAWASAAAPNLVLDEVDKLLSEDYQHEQTSLFSSSSIEQHIL